MPDVTILGLVMTALAMLGFAFIDQNTPFWYLALLMIVMGVGGGLFASPNIKSIMSTVPPERRGIAAGTRTMLMNTGTMLSLAIAMPLVLSGLSTQDMLDLFLYGGGISTRALTIFDNGLHLAFLVFFVTAIAAILIALIKKKEKMPESSEVTIKGRRKYV